MDAEKAAFAWLIDPVTENKMKRTVLAELGRLEDPDAIREYARVISLQKTSAREAVARLRRLRVEPKATSIAKLRDELIRVLDDYRLGHPEFTVEEMLDAVEDLRWTMIEIRDSGILEKFSEKPPGLR